MTPKEKAVELIDFFTFNCKECDNAKISALIAVDEVLNAVLAVYQPETKRFWYEVKQEIEKL
jgi:hypothetical protein